MHIPLSDIVIVGIDVVNISSEENTSSLTASLWFYNEGSGLALHKLVSEVAIFSRQQPCLRKKLEFIKELLSHLHKIPTQMVLAGERVHTWKVIDFLVSCKFNKLIRCILPRVSGYTAASVQNISQLVASTSYYKIHLNNFLPTNLTTSY